LDLSRRRSVATGEVVILNGVPRAGKSSIVRVIQETFPGIWMNLGVEMHKDATPPRAQPGIGLRPGAGQVSLEVENWVPVLYAALFESVAAHARLGLNVVTDVGLHDEYSKPRGIRADCARRMAGLPALFVGVHCTIDVLWERRAQTWGQVRGEVDDGVTAAVELGQRAMHAHSGYDVEVDTSVLGPVECAEVIRKRLLEGPPGSMFAELAVTS
jgi:chloramphenicol 3-O phosphotransferase